jgi:hypothetical protein
MWTNSKDQIIITPNLKVNAVRIVHASSVKAPELTFHKLKPQRRVTDISANEPKGADKLALQILVVRIQLIPNGGTNQEGPPRGRR